MQVKYCVKHPRCGQQCVWPLNSLSYLWVLCHNGGPGQVQNLKQKFTTGVVLQRTHKNMSLGLVSYSMSASARLKVGHQAVSTCVRVGK